MTPNYKKIYTDMISIQYPDKMVMCHDILSKEKLNRIDVINLNKIISNSNDINIKHENQKLKSYDKETIFNILDFQKKNNLTNSYVSKHFNLSRNTLAKWKKIFF